MNQRVAKEAANHEKTKTLPLKHQKTILNFDATFAKATNDVVVVVIATALGNQKTQLLNHVSEKAATIQNASQRMRMSLASRRVAKETANLEKTKTLPRKHQKTILNFDATFAKVAKVRASDVVAVVKAIKAQATQRMRMLPVNQRVAKE